MNCKQFIIELALLLLKSRLSHILHSKEMLDQHRLSSISKLLCLQQCLELGLFHLRKTKNDCRLGI